MRITFSVCVCVCVCAESKTTLFHTSKGLYTWTDLHTCAKFCINLHTYMYAYLSMCTHLLMYAKFGRMQKLENLHLVQTKCKSDFAYMEFANMQIISMCKGLKT